MSEPPKAVQPPIRTPLRKDAEIAPGIRNAKVTITRSGAWDYQITLTYEEKLPKYFNLKDEERWATFTWAQSQRLGRERAVKKGHDMMREFMLAKTTPKPEPIVIYPNDVCP